VKSLGTTEKLIVEGRLSNEQELEALKEKRLEAKQKYELAVQMLEASFQTAKMPALADLVGDAGDGDKKKRKSKGKPKAKGKSKPATPAKGEKQNSTD
jgi:hypothetical protein